MGFGGEAGRDESGRECAHGAGYSSGAAKCESRLEGNNSFRAERGGATPPACAGSQRPKWVYLGPDFLYRAHCPVYRKTAFLAVSRTARRRQPMPVIGMLDSRSPDALMDRLRGFRQGLKDTGYVEGENVAIEYRWAENQFDRLPALAAELVRRRVAVIATSGGPAVAFAAKAATTTIPIVFIVNEDPVSLGLVASLARPGGNATGINILTAELTAKRLDLLRELVPGAARVGVLVNPAQATSAESTLRDVAAAARITGLQIKVLNASTNLEIEAAFASFMRERPDALFVGADAYFFSRRVQLTHLASHLSIPATYAQRDYVEAGGLMSYGSNLTDAFRQIGVYAGRILKGAKAADLPVVQSSKFELVINISTARMLGLTVPDKLLVAADEVIE
jgi:putative tryptophan/tyrosine transport system substrate-binding protein